MIPVTKPFIPPINEYNKYISDIWERNWLTNNGPLVNNLELKLKEYFGIAHLLYVSNGTIALQIAIKALALHGEVITTPFSYIATTSSLVWEGMKPVFCDIDEETLNIDVKKIEALISKKTSAILATHVYGNPCDIDAIEKIAKTHNLKVIYDAAHCFGTNYKGKSIFCYGDIVTTSFHATKLFHTVEGGAIFSNNPDLIKTMSFMRNFGHLGTEDFHGIGINGKNSEFHAAMGLCNLPYVDEIISRRKVLSEHYEDKLSTLKYKRPVIRKYTEYNYAYFPIILESEDFLIKVVKTLNENSIFPRRYFYPSLNTINYVKGQVTPISESISESILCLPLYHTLKKEEIDLIARLMLRAQNY